MSKKICSKSGTSKQKSEPILKKKANMRMKIEDKTKKRAKYSNTT